MKNNFTRGPIGIKGQTGNVPLHNQPAFLTHSSNTFFRIQTIKDWMFGEVAVVGARYCRAPTADP